ncbi:MAG: GNAT family N-acetyltransferase [Acidimicrobiales bacterium]
MSRALTTDRLEVRPLTAADVEAVFTVHSDAATMADVRWQTMTERREAEERVVSELANERDTGFGMYVLHERQSGALVGLCGAARDGNGLEVGWTVLKRFQSLGYATEAASALIGDIETAGWPEVVAKIRPSNLASRRVAEKLQFDLDAAVTDEYGELLIFKRSRSSASPR